MKFRRIPIKPSAKVIFRHQKSLLEQIAPGPLKQSYLERKILSESTFFSKKDNISAKSHF